MSNIKYIAKEGLNEIWKIDSIEGITSSLNYILTNTDDVISLSSNGALKVEGGAVIGKSLFLGINLNVGNNVSVGGTTTSTGSITINDNTDATNSSNGGSFTTLGGAAIAKKLFVGTNLSVGGTTTSTGSITINDTTDATNSSNGGSFTVKGGAAVAKQLFVGTDLNVGSNVYSNNKVLPTKEYVDNILATKQDIIPIVAYTIPTNELTARNVVIAHRFGAGTLPQYSLSNMLEHLVRGKMHHIEFDVSKTSDNVYYLSHGGNPEEYLSTEQVSPITKAAIDAGRIASGNMGMLRAETVPTLEEAWNMVRAYEHVIIWMECKNGDAVGTLAECQRIGLGPDRCVFQDFDFDQIQVFKAAGYTTLWMVNDATTLSNTATTYGDQFDYVCCDANVIASIHPVSVSLNKPFFVYTLQSPYNWTMLKSSYSGLIGCFSDAPIPTYYATTYRTSPELLDPRNGYVHITSSQAQMTNVIAVPEEQLVRLYITGGNSLFARAANFYGYKLPDTFYGRVKYQSIQDITRWCGLAIRFSNDYQETDNVSPLARCIHTIFRYSGTVGMYIRDNNTSASLQTTVTNTFTRSVTDFYYGYKRVHDDANGRSFIYLRLGNTLADVLTPDVSPHGTVTLTDAGGQTWRKDNIYLTLTANGVINGSIEYFYPNSTYNGVRYSDLNTKRDISTLINLSTDTTGILPISKLDKTTGLTLTQTHAQGTSVDQFVTNLDNNWKIRLAQNYAGVGNIYYEWYNTYNATERKFMTIRNDTLTLESPKISVSSTTDASSSTNGGSFTILGGAAIAKKLYVGDNIYANGNKVVATEEYVSNQLTLKQNTITSSTDITPKKVTAADTVAAPGFLANNQGDNTYTGYVLATKGGSASLFRNSEDRAADGGVNTTTLRNDNGNLRLLAYSPGYTETGIHVDPVTRLTTVYHDLTVLGGLVAPNAQISGWGLNIQDKAYAEGEKQLATREYVDSGLSTKQNTITTSTNLNPSKITLANTTDASSSNDTSASLYTPGGISVVKRVLSGQGFVVQNFDTSHKVLGQFLQPNLATSVSTAIVMGTDLSLNNSMFLNFTNKGGTGSSENHLQMGIYGATKWLSVDNAGNAYAEGDKRLATREYVDTGLSAKQNTITGTTDLVLKSLNANIFVGTNDTTSTSGVPAAFMMQNIAHGGNNMVLLGKSQSSTESAAFYYIHHTDAPYRRACLGLQNCDPGLQADQDGNLFVKRVLPYTTSANPPVLGSRSSGYRYITYQSPDFSTYTDFGIGIEDNAQFYAVGGYGDSHKFYCRNVLVNSIGAYFNTKINPDPAQYCGFAIANDAGGVAAIFRNGSSRSPDGGPKMFTMRNDDGPTRVMATSDNYGIVFGTDNTQRATGDLYANNTKLVATKEYVDAQIAGLSDYRLKENIIPMDLSTAEKKLMKLKPSKFNFIGNDETINGFIAHEVSEIVPEAVIGNKDALDENGEIIPQRLNQSKLIPLLTAAIQNLTIKLEEMLNRISFLESKVEKL